MEPSGRERSAIDPEVEAFGREFIDESGRLGVGAAVERAIRELVTRGYRPRTALLLETLLRHQRPELVVALMREIPPVRRSFSERLHLIRALEQLGEWGEAESQWRVLAEIDPDAIGPAEGFAALLGRQGRFSAATEVRLTAARRHLSDGRVVFEAAQFARRCGRQAEALALCEEALRASSGDTSLLALAGTLSAELGRFDEARQYYEGALKQGLDLERWSVLPALAHLQRYDDPDHLDLARMRRELADPRRGEQTRTALHFALGKAADDLGRYAEAAEHFRLGNAAVARRSRWSIVSWQRFVDQMCAARSLPAVPDFKPDRFQPLFLVGMPRSGTTLLARLLARHPAVRDRGELPMLGHLAGEAAMSGLQQNREVLQRARDLYAMHSRQDDAPAALYIDKTPLNFRYINVAHAMFPGAPIIWMRRGAPDVALSNWMQHYAGEHLDFSCRFEWLAAVGNSCDRLMAHWQTLLPLNLRVVEYESLVADPERVVDEIREWLKLPDIQSPAPRAEAGIATASLWQARQAVHRTSIDRWRSYLPHVPELQAIVAP